MSAELLAAVVQQAELADQDTQRARTKNDHLFRSGRAAGLWGAANLLADELGLAAAQCPGKLAHKRVLRERYEYKTCGACGGSYAGGGGCPVCRGPR